jgi:hypothetical protein
MLGVVADRVPLMWRRLFEWFIYSRAHFIHSDSRLYHQGVNLTIVPSRESEAYAEVL